MIALVAVLAVALADAATPSIGLSWLTPGFITALTTLIVAITGLLALFKKTSDTKAVAEDTNAKVSQVATAANGVAAVREARLTYLEKELAGTAHRSDSRSASGATGPPSPSHVPLK
jgi:hypothetical protein